MSRMKRIGNVLANVLLYAFLVLCIFSVIMTLLSKKDVDGAAEIFGYQMRVVTSSSMEKSEHTDVSAYKIKDIPVRSVVFVKVMPDDPEKATEWYRGLKKGDVLTFRYVYTNQVTITHRISKDVIEKPTGGFIIELSGDNKDAEDGIDTQIIDTSIPYNTNYVIGEVVGQAYILGVILSFLMTTLGTVLVIILPCAIIIMFEVMKIVKVVLADKKERDREEKEKNQSELDELRKRLAELERERSEADAKDAGLTSAENAVESTESASAGKPAESTDTLRSKDTVESAETPSAEDTAGKTGSEILKNETVDNNTATDKKTAADAEDKEDKTV